MRTLNINIGTPVARPLMKTTWTRFEDKLPPVDDAGWSKKLLVTDSRRDDFNIVRMKLDFPTVKLLDLTCDIEVRYVTGVWWMEIPELPS